MPFVSSWLKDYIFTGSTGQSRFTGAFGRRNSLGLEYLHVTGTFLFHDIHPLQGILYLAHGREVLAHFKKYFQGL